MPVSDVLSNLSSFLKACFDFGRLIGAGNNREIVPFEKLIQSITIILSEDAEAVPAIRYSLIYTYNKVSTFECKIYISLDCVCLNRIIISCFLHSFFHICM